MAGAIGAEDGIAGLVPAELEAFALLALRRLIRDNSPLIRFPTASNSSACSCFCIEFCTLPVYAGGI